MHKTTVATISLRSMLSSTPILLPNGSIAMDLICEASANESVDNLLVVVGESATIQEMLLYLFSALVIGTTICSGK